MNNLGNWIHLTAGIISISVAVFFSRQIQLSVMWVFTILTISGAIYSIISQHYLKINVEDPIEEIIYFTMGNLALLVFTLDARQQQKMEMGKRELFSSKTI